MILSVHWRFPSTAAVATSVRLAYLLLYFRLESGIAGRNQSHFQRSNGGRVVAKKYSQPTILN